MHSIRSDFEPVDPSRVPLYTSEIDITLYTQVAILTILVYDTVTTMDKEIKYFWDQAYAYLLCGMKSSPRKFVSLIYFTNRYIGILGAFSGVMCALDLPGFKIWLIFF
ncbi:hypothetical protein DFH11DRAFT_1830614 [Phellopilus nigrolimitatus]|nr:hypothetical protein DFH11DRAFT_1830614 [Phellopilus nigrolimitatus]